MCLFRPLQERVQNPVSEKMTKSWIAGAFLAVVLPDLPFLGVYVKTKENDPKHQGFFYPSQPQQTRKKNREKQLKTRETPRNFLG